MKVILALVALCAAVSAVPPQIIQNSRTPEKLNPENAEIPVVAPELDQNEVPQSRKLKTTADRIRSHGWPVEEHEVQTADGYILTMYRIPYSHRRNNQNQPNKPVVFLMHGLLSSSDCWILNGPDNALAYLFADAGFDVWMGNQRGNTYGRRHVTKSPLFPPFWDFSWHEIGVHDVPAMIDYILFKTNQAALHYVGHSQGTTVYLVMLSMVPRYNSKIKTAHMLAPGYYMEHMRTPLATVCGPLLGYPTLLSALIGSHEFSPNNEFKAQMGSAMCKENSIFISMCENSLFLIAGWDSSHMNLTLMPDVMETNPAGASTSQSIHYLQEYESGKFRQFDHGYFGNQFVYGQGSPPDYLVENVRPSNPIQFYYSDNDWLSDPRDVLRMAKQLGSKVQLNHVPYSDWNHLDFLWAQSIKETINDPVIKYCSNYEGMA